MPKTVWEMLKSKFAEEIALQIDNPLKLRIGDLIRIDELDLKGLDFCVGGILEYERVESKETFLFTDYDLLARSMGKDDVKLRLRLNPLKEADQSAGLTHSVVVLKLYDELNYTEEFHKVVTDTTETFEVLENGVCTERYWRMGSGKEPYKAVITELCKGNKASTYRSELIRRNIEYWDYNREIKDEAGQSLIEYLFVEMDSTTGYFQLWKGPEIDPIQVLLF